MIGFVYGIIALSILVVVHEFGHFIIARLVNVKVITFSVGFGKKLLTWKRGDTEYAISAMPLGGYVKLLGESPDEEVPEEEKDRSFTNKTPFQRFLIVFAGPVFNIVFAILIIYCSIIMSGYGVRSAYIGAVEKDFPAWEAGLRPGDRIVEINGVKINDWQDIMKEMAFAGNSPMKFAYERDSKAFQVVITPKEVEENSELGNTVKRKKVGIAPKDDVIPKKENVLSAIPKSLEMTWKMTATMVRGLYHMVVGDISTKEIGGPIAIMQLMGKQAEHGIWSLVTFIAFISINLGVLNLLPIPVLDGGHILFNFIEIVTRRKVSEKVIDIGQKIGLSLLILLMAFAFYNDIMRNIHPIVEKTLGVFRFFSGKPSP